MLCDSPHPSQTSIRELRKLCPTDSVWSIDLAYLLHHFRLRTLYFTATRGVRPEYGDEEFYREQFPQDTKRVNRLFAQAERKGVRVIERTVSLQDIRRAVDTGTLAIILLDKRLLRCAFCERGRRVNGVDVVGRGSDVTRVVGRTATSGDIGPASSSLSTQTRQALGFLGHYVVVYAYCAQEDVFLIKDPAVLRDTCVVASGALDEARMAFGTDQDVLFVGEVE